MFEHHRTKRTLIVAKTYKDCVRYCQANGMDRPESHFVSGTFQLVGLKGLNLRVVLIEDWWKRPGLDVRRMYEHLKRLEREGAELVSG